MTTLRELLDEVRGQVAEVTPEGLEAALASGRPPVVVDVREAEEYAEGCLPGALHLPRGFLELRAEAALPDRGANVVLYCAGGVRSLLAADALRRLGYQNVASLAGGFARWAGGGRSVYVPRVLSAAERRRYRRHLSIPEVGERGQIALLSSRVLLVGAGGLGSPAAYYLAAAGVGTLGIVDDDVVDESNLQRQILHSVDRVGRPKVESAAAALSALNPAVKVEALRRRLCADNVLSTFDGYDVIVDGSDNFTTRYLINDACVMSGKPVVHGSVYRFDGQVTVFRSPDGPCYRCLYPEPPPPDMAPSCAEGGVLGVLPGVVGLLQAVEAVKLLLNVGTPLVGKLLQYDALRAEFRTLKLRRDPACPRCAEGRRGEGLVEQPAACGV